MVLNVRQRSMHMTEQTLISLKQMNSLHDWLNQLLSAITLHCLIVVPVLRRTYSDRIKCRTDCITEAERDRIWHRVGRTLATVWSYKPTP